jgi:tetratricopeptide (TPR) repeat protein
MARHGKRRDAMPHRIKALSILTICASFAIAADARAELLEAAEPEHVRTEDEPEGYRRWIETAIAEYDAGHYEEAFALFSKAHTLAPSARTHRGLGSAAFELRHYVESIEHLEAALRSSEKPLAGSLRETTEALLERAREYVGELVLKLHPAQARVFIDGAQTPARGTLPIRLSIGRHELEAQAEAHVPERRTVEITRGAPKVVVWQLAPLPVAEPRSPAQGARDVPHGQPWYKRAWVWAAVGVVAAGAITTAVLTTRSRSLGDEYNGSSGVRLTAP